MAAKIADPLSALFKKVTVFTLSATSSSLFCSSQWHYDTSASAFSLPQFGLPGRVFPGKGAHENEVIQQAWTDGVAHYAFIV